MNRLFATGIFLIALACGVLFVPFMQGRLQYNDLSGDTIVDALNDFSSKSSEERSLALEFDTPETSSSDYPSADVFAGFNGVEEPEVTDAYEVKETNLEPTKTPLIVARFEEVLEDAKQLEVHLEEQVEPLVEPLHDKVAALSKPVKRDVFNAFVSNDSKEEKNTVNLDSGLLESSENMLLSELLKYRKQVRELNYSLELSVEREAKLARQVARFKSSKKNFKNTESKKTTALETENEALEKKLSRSEKELKIAKELLKERNQEFASLQSKQRLDKDILSTQESKVKKLEKELASAVEKVGECSFELTDAKRDISSKDGMAKELVNTKHELLLKAAEIKNLTSVGVKKQEAKVTPAAKDVRQTAAVSVQKAVAKINKSNSDVQTVRVNVDKANLRNGPGMEHSAVMQLPKGATLVVEARQGDWYRVISPKGTRAFIKSEVVKSEVARGKRTSQLVAKPRAKKRVAKAPRQSRSGDIGGLNLAQRAMLKSAKQPRKKARFVGDVPTGFVPFEKKIGSPKDEIEKRAYEALKKRLLNR